MYECAKRYAYSIPRGLMLWDDSKTCEQKAEDMAVTLHAMGYRLQKIEAEEAVIIESELVTPDGE